MRALESAAGRYDRGIHLLTLGRIKGLYDWLAARVRPGWRVLDLGTGTGALALRAAARGAEVTALDINPAMLEIARRKAKEAGLEGRIAWREMGVAELDAFLDGEFDAVSAGLCFSELTPAERRYALRQARRLLRPGGLFLLVDEVPPQRLFQRLLYTVVRVPLVVVTWLLTQTTTHPLPGLLDMIEVSGLRIMEQRTALFGSLVVAVAVAPHS